MRLQSVSLRGRRFAIQLGTIMQEFGNVIPWLDGVRGLEWATNGTYVHDEILRRLRLETGDLTPYHFVTRDRSREFHGGILAFARSPERFIDPRNIAATEELDAIGAGYISCLQVLPDHQGHGTGSTLMRRALAVILEERGYVWGVISNQGLLPWYRSLGATVKSPIENRDNLWIVTWTKHNATP